MLTDIQIAQAAHMQPVSEVAAKLGIYEDELEHYGKYKAKLSESLWARVKDPTKWKIDSRHCSESNAGRRRKNDHDGRFGPGDGKAGISICDLFA